MYRTIDAAFWTDPKIRSLGPEGKLLALYLVTNPHGHVGGIYYLPDDLIRVETGLRQEVLDSLWDTLSSVGFARKDKELDVVWVLRMFAYQGRGEKNERAVAKQLESLHNSSLIKDFLQVYPTVKRYAIDRVCNGRTAQDQRRTPEQEQEQDIKPPIVPQGTSDRDDAKPRPQKKKPPEEYSRAFEEFWSVYPPLRRQGKRAAWQAWRLAITRAIPAVILAAAREFAASPRGKGRFCPGPAPWLNQERWQDDRAAWQTSGDEPAGPHEPVDAPYKEY